MIQDFKLYLFLTLAGLSAASGIVYQEGNLYTVSDNAVYLYSYETATEAFTKTSLLNTKGKVLEGIPKNEKPDFEALALVEKTLYAFGSGSSEKREIVVTRDLVSGTSKVIPSSLLYTNLRKVSGLTRDDLNIEGAVFYKNKWYLFQRGNGPKRANGIFTVNGAALSGDEKITFKPVILPTIKGVHFTFTDAALAGDDIYFLAAAEQTASTTEDGAILGSLVGRISPFDFSIPFMRKISDTQKFEGLTLYKNSRINIEFLLCEDNDNGASDADIYHLSFAK